MEQQEQLTLEPSLNKVNIRRRDLLPVWIKIFIWIFMITGAVAPLALVAAVFGANFQVELYGLGSDNPDSPLAMFVTVLFIFKGIVAFGLWTEKDWAVNLGIADAIIGIAVCAFVMFIYPFILQEPGFAISLRLELAALIPYLIKLQRIKPQWSLK